MDADNGLWFPVLSDFWPHGKVCDACGVPRSNGTADRALFLVDKQGRLRFIHVSDINVRPELGKIMHAIEKLPRSFFSALHPVPVFNGINL